MTGTAHGANLGNEDAVLAVNWNAVAAVPNSGAGTFLRTLRSCADMLFLG